LSWKRNRISNKEFKNISLQDYIVPVGFILVPQEWFYQQWTMPFNKLKSLQCTFNQINSILLSTNRAFISFEVFYHNEVISTPQLLKIFLLVFHLNQQLYLLLFYFPRRTYCRFSWLAKNWRRRNWKRLKTWKTPGENCRYRWNVEDRRYLTNCATIEQFQFEINVYSYVLWCGTLLWNKAIFFFCYVL
jgi:hypothetical protein